MEDIKRLRRIWKMMKQRCYNPNNDSYKNYGARGITVCDEWLPASRPFIDWDLANGYENDLTIDRIDSDKGYSPDNCRWITREENTRRALKGRKINRKKGYKVGTRKTTKLYEFNGKKQSLEEWSKEVGISRTTLNMRINHYKWDIERALTAATTKRKGE